MSDNQPVAWRYRWRDGGDWKLSFHFDDGLDPAKYEQEPLFTRHAEQAVTYSDEAMLEMASDAYRRGVDRSSFAQAAEWAFDEAKDDALTAALAQKEGGR